VVFVLEGQGEALLDGADKVPMVKGTCIFLGKGRSCNCSTHRRASWLRLRVGSWERVAAEPLGVFPRL